MLILVLRCFAGLTAGTRNSWGERWETANAYQHCLAPQLRVIQLFHRGVEGAKVGVDDVTHR